MSTQDAGQEQDIIFTISLLQQIVFSLILQSTDSQYSRVEHEQEYSKWGASYLRG